MSNKIIPKEQLTAYQRWELGAFDSGVMPGDDSGSAETAPVGEVVLPTAEEIERIHQQARDEGYQAGFSEGREAGLQESARLHELLAATNESIAAMQEQLAQQVLSLSLRLARHLVRQELTVKPELVLNAIREALAAMPQSGQPFRITLHPSDAALIRDVLANELTHAQYVLLEDPAVGAGGCRIDSAQAEIDATLATAWSQALTALGRDDDWQE